MALRAPKNLKATIAGTVGLRDELREEAARRRAAKSGRARTMRAWALLVPERGLPLDLGEFPFQEEWYSEEVANAKHAVWQKAAQIGMSGYCWRWAGRRAEQFGDRVLYFFPTDDDVSDFGDTRIEPSIQDSTFLLSRIPPGFVQQKHLKQIGSGWLALRGTQSRTAVQSVDADALVFDEYDYLHQRNLAQAERRVAGAKAAGREPRIRRFGYPTVAGAGINARYMASDRRVWHVTCPRCETEQPLQWRENVRWRTTPDGPVCQWGHDEYESGEDVAEAWRCCKDCGESFETPRGVKGPIHRGRWIATNPGADVIGFHASRLIVPRTDLIELVRNSRKTAPHEQEAFWNNDMGEPYSPAEAALTEEQVLAACSMGLGEGDRIRTRNIRVGGLDVASERALSMWVDEITPDGKQRALYLGEPEDFYEAARVMRQYNVALLVVDSMPERRMARAFAKQFPGRVVLAAYDARNEADAFRYDPRKNLVTINRTEGLDAFMDSVRNLRRLPLQRPPRRFVSQLLSPKRRTVEDTRGRPQRIYVSTGPDGDDFAHAGVYALVAYEMWRLRAAVQRKVDASRGRMPDERHGLREDDDYRPGFDED